MFTYETANDDWNELLLLLVSVATLPPTLLQRHGSLNVALTVIFADLSVSRSGNRQLMPSGLIRSTFGSLLTQYSAVDVHQTVARLVPTLSRRTSRTRWQLSVLVQSLHRARCSSPALLVCLCLHLIPSTVVKLLTSFANYRTNAMLLTRCRRLC